MPSEHLKTPRDEPEYGKEHGHRHPGQSPSPSPTLKVVLLGDLGVGKTCLRSQFVHHVFSNAYKATIGGDYLTTTVEIEAGRSLDGSRDMCIAGPTTVSLQVWDTAGQERFNLISQAFYRGADVAVLVYDVTSYESLLSVRDWFARFMQHCQVGSPGIVIVGNKLDQELDRAVDRGEVHDVLCRNASVPLEDHVDSWAEDLMEISARNLAAVEAVFQRVAVVGLAKGCPQRDRCASPRSVVLGDALAVSSRCAC